MILGLGTDITDCMRIEKMIQRHGDYFLRRILTEREAAEFDGISYLAGRWCAKEALPKLSERESVQSAHLRRFRFCATKKAGVPS